MKTFAVLLGLLGLCQAVDWDTITVLDTYVNTPEAVYSYTILDVTPVTGATVHILNMTSLQWFDESVTTTPIWWHYQVVVIPDVINYFDSALLYVSGGSNTGAPPTILSGAVQDMVDFAINVGAVTSLVEMIPNQPLYFMEEGGTNGRTEDAIIGYSWKLFIEETIDDPLIIANLPMTKAAKQAADTMIDYAASIDPSIQITQYMPTGYSKRGWVSWLLGSVDQRVFAMAPIVFDLLNFLDNMHHHYQSLGGWSWAFSPYWDAGVPRYLHHPRTAIVADHIDGLFYVERLTMPKMLFGGTGDQFFIPDGTHYWWDQMPGNNHYMLFENADHILLGRSPWPTTEAFFVSVREGIPLPQYSFTRNEGVNSATITLTTNTQPNWVVAWVAHNSNRTCENDDPTQTCRRDFRLARRDIPTDTWIEWTPTILTDQGGGVYQVTHPHRTDFGQTIFHIEMEYPGPDGRVFVFTTEAHITPDTMPYPLCVTEIICQGNLV